MYYIDKQLYTHLKQTVLKCGGTISEYIYMNHFDNKERMTTAEFLNLRMDIKKELITNITIKTENLYDKYNKPAIDELKRILNL